MPRPKATWYRPQDDPQACYTLHGRTDTTTTKRSMREHLLATLPPFKRFHARHPRCLHCTRSRQCFRGDPAPRRQRRSRRALMLLAASAFCAAALRPAIISAPVAHRAALLHMSAHARIVVAQHNAPSDEALESLAAIDAGFPSRVVTAPSAEHARQVLSPVGSLQGETDDVRKVGDAAAAGASAALAMGATELTLHVDEAISSQQHPADGNIFAHAALVAQLGVLQRAYVPLQAREAQEPLGSTHLCQLKVSGTGCQPVAGVAEAIEAGRALARDIGSGDPERMAPLRLAEAVRAALADEDVEVRQSSRRAQWRGVIVANARSSSVEAGTVAGRNSGRRAK